MTTIQTLTAVLGGSVAALGLGTAIWRLWLRTSRRRAEHHADHLGHPPRVDPATGRVIEEARPGIAMMLNTIGAAIEQISGTVTAIGARQEEMSASVAALKGQMAGVSDNGDTIASILSMLHERRRVEDVRHAQNQAKVEQARATAEGSRADVATLRLVVREAQETLRDVEEKVVGKVTHIEEAQEQLRTAVDQRFSEHLLAEQTFVAALHEQGVGVDWPAPDRNIQVSYDRAAGDGG